MRRPFTSFAPAVVVAATLAVGARPGLAAVAPAMSFEQVARAWMGAVALLAHGDDDRDDGDRRDGAKSRPEGRRGAGGHESRARAHGHHKGPGPQAVMAKMDEILARLARIEARLDGRAGGPPAAGMHGPRPGRPEVPEHARRMMEERMRRMHEGMGPEDRARMEERMRAARERMREGGPRPEGRPEMPAEAREQMRKRMEEGRERMEQARETIRRMEERIGKLEAQIERLKADR